MKQTGHEIRSQSPPSFARELRTLALLFLKLGTIAFGGPAAHIAMMEDEVVRRRKWLAHEEFLDLLDSTNLIPGPNSTEGQRLDAIAVGQATPGPVFTTATFIGYVRAGKTGALLATIGIFLRAFIFVAISGPLIPCPRNIQEILVLEDKLVADGSLEALSVPA